MLSRGQSIAAATAFGVVASLACAAHRNVTATVNETPRPDASHLVWLSKEPQGTSKFTLVLFLDGSGCASVVRLAPYLPVFIDAGFGVVVPEKRGVEPGDDGVACRSEFLRTNDRLTRVADADLVIAQLAGRFPRWNGKLIVMGGSEGASLAPEIATHHFGETVAVVLMGGGGWDQATELKVLAEKNREDAGSFETQFALMEANPTSAQSWLGESNTYRRWASYLRYRPLDYLIKVDAPIYVVHGTRDVATPIESPEAIATTFKELGKTNLTLREWQGLDHRWTDAQGKNHLHEVGGEMVEWMQEVTVARP